MNSRSSARQDVWKFCAIPAAPGAGSHWDDWKRDCASLGAAAPTVLLEVLRDGDQTQQEGALLCLRVHGFEAYGVGLPTIVEYKVRGPGAKEFETIKPEILPDDPT